MWGTGWVLGRPAHRTAWPRSPSCYSLAAALLCRRPLPAPHKLLGSGTSGSLPLRAASSEAMNPLGVEECACVCKRA